MCQFLFSSAYQRKLEERFDYLVPGCWFPNLVQVEFGGRLHVPGQGLFLLWKRWWASFSKLRLNERFQELLKSFFKCNCDPALFHEGK